MALSLPDAGMEVVDTGMSHAVDVMVPAAMQEDMQIVGLRLLSGAYLGLATPVLER